MNFSIPNAVPTVIRILATHFLTQLKKNTELAEKIQEFNQYISDLSDDINEIPAIGTELCHTVALELHV